MRLLCPVKGERELRDHLKLKVLILQFASFVDLKGEQRSCKEDRLSRRIDGAEPGIVTVDAADDKILCFHGYVSFLRIQACRFMLSQRNKILNAFGFHS